MVPKMELVLVMFAVASCFAQDIAFQEDESLEDTNNRVGLGNQRPAWFVRPRPGGDNFGSSNPGQFAQNFNPNSQFSQNSNKVFSSNSPQSIPSDSNFNGGFAPSTPPPAQTTQGSLRPPPRSSQKIISLVPCSCPFTPEYSPVCGSDSQTYLNTAVLNCFRVCGFDVSVARLSACSQTAGRTRISK